MTRVWKAPRTGSRVHPTSGGVLLAQAECFRLAHSGVPEFLPLMIGWLNCAHEASGRTNGPGERIARRDDQSVFQFIAKGGVTFQGWPLVSLPRRPMRSEFGAKFELKFKDSTSIAWNRRRPKSKPNRSPAKPAERRSPKPTDSIRIARARPFPSCARKSIVVARKPVRNRVSNRSSIEPRRKQQTGWRTRSTTSEKHAVYSSALPVVESNTGRAAFFRPSGTFDRRWLRQFASGNLHGTEE